jgi:hypothetical protein
MVDSFQGRVIDSLNAQDSRNEDLLDRVVKAADEVSRNDEIADVTLDGDPETHEAGSIQWGGKEASLQGTAGVALLQFAQDAIQTAVSNISSVGTNQMNIRKIAERKFTA